MPWGPERRTRVVPVSDDLVVVFREQIQFADYDADGGKGTPPQPFALPRRNSIAIEFVNWGVWGCPEASLAGGWVLLAILGPWLNLGCLGKPRG